MRITVKGVLIFIGLEILILAIAVAVHSQEQPKFGPQLVFHVNHSAGGLKTVIVKEVVPVLVLEPADPTSDYAPMSQGTNMLCRAIYEYHDSEGRLKMAWQCGTDKYVTRVITLMPKDEYEKEIKGK